MFIRKLRTIIVFGALLLVGLIFIAATRLKHDTNTEEVKPSGIASNQLSLGDTESVPIERDSSAGKKLVQYGADVTTESDRQNSVVPDLGTVIPVPAPSLAKLKSEKIKIALEEIESFAAKNIDENAYSEPKTILIASSWRTGSTFFAEAISSHPAVFYHYEPLVGFSDLNTVKKLNEGLKTIEYLDNCDYRIQFIKKYMDSLKKDLSNLNQNNKIKRACEYLGKDCLDMEFLSKACSAFPHQLFKFVRMRVADLESFLEQNAHVILLVRDPRAVFASRMKVSWCGDIRSCSKPDVFCKHSTTDLLAFNTLQRQYPNQVHLVRFEDLAMDPPGVLKELLGALGMEWDSAIDTYLQEHTNADLDKPWSTYRVSRLRVDNWKPDIRAEMIGVLQKDCDEFMSELNYTKIDITRCDEYC